MHIIEKKNGKCEKSEKIAVIGNGGLRMEDIALEIGQKIRHFRKQRNISLREMAETICKSKSTLSKYENGQIAVDIVTLYEIARALGIHVEQILYSQPMDSMPATLRPIPAFFRNNSQFYLYYYDGRNDSLNRCVLDVISQTETDQYKVMMYMNVESYAHYQNCENTYWGFLHHYDAMSRLTLINRDTAMEQVTISVLASFLDADTRMGLFTGFSSRPMMPVATKVLLSRNRLKEDGRLLEQLRISKTDIKTMKLYNMFTVT